MIRNYLKIAWRSLTKAGLFTIIKILGLSLGIIISLPIFLIIKDELSYDRFHSKKDRIYRAWVDEEYGDGVEYLSTVTPKVLGSTLKNNIPEVESTTRIENFSDYVMHKEELFSQVFTLVDPSFFKMFDFRLLAGSTNKIFNDIYEVALSEEMAIRYFGQENPIGKNLKLRVGDEFQEYKVVAVLENPPSSSSVKLIML